MQHIDEIGAHKKNVEQETLRLAEPYSIQLNLIRTTPGLSGDPMTAIAILSEVGADMSVFPTAKHLVSWAGCCPRNDQSNGKVKSTRISRAGAYLILLSDEKNGISPAFFPPYFIVVLDGRKPRCVLRLVWRKNCSEIFPIF